MFGAIKLTLALATFKPFHADVRATFYFPSPLAMPVEASLMICLEDRQIESLWSAGIQRA